jgi:methyl-accepting chemotaxis protein/methyl-accepting chemotaxis protein-1 (serine sensor receptor)
MTIQKKLYLAFAAALGVGALISAIGIVSVQRLSAAVADLSVRAEEATYAAGQIDTITSDMQAQQRGMIMRRFAHQEEQSDKLIADNITSVGSLHKFADQYRSLAVKPEVLTKLKILTDNLAIIDEKNPAFLDQVRHGELEEAVKSLDSGLADATDKASAQGAELLDLQRQTAHADGEIKIAEAARDNWLMLLMLAPLIVVAFITATMIRNLIEQLRQNRRTLSEAACQIATAANQIREASDSLAQGASEEAATIEETSAASSEINSMARRATENAQSTAEMVARSQQNAATTDAALNRMLLAMDGINASSEKISKIIKVIDEIAFQTNILALNAAVEAARAGDAGMGFAVVADEVRNLAQRCAQAAKDTTELIEDSVQRSADGRAIVREVADSTREITADAGKVKLLVDEISLGSREQSRGIEQITKSIQDMESVTQGTAAAAEQSAAAAHELTSQTVAMREAVESLGALIESAQVRQRLAA